MGWQKYFLTFLAKSQESVIHILAFSSYIFFNSNTFFGWVTNLGAEAFVFSIISN